MIYSFAIYSASTGALLPSVAATLSIFQRTNLDGTINALTPHPTISQPAANGTYSFPIDDALFEPGCTIDLVIDCGVLAAARYLEDHLRGDLFRVASVQVADSSVDFTIKRTVLAPAFQVPLLDGRGGRLKLSDTATVRFRMRAVGGSVLVVDDEAEVVNADRGLVQYAWQDGDTATPGVYDAEFVTTDGDDIRIEPTSTFYRIEILPSLAD